MQYKTVRVKNLTIGEGMPRICVPVMGKTADEILSHTRRAAAVRPDLLEWRADSCEQILEPGAAQELLQEIRGAAGQIPVLFTFRSAGEGGQRAITPEAYVRLNLEAAESGYAELIDVEAQMEHLDAAELTEKLHAEGCRVIASRHFFDQTPPQERMREVFASLEASGADIMKLAVMPATRRDVLRLLDLTQEMITSSPCPIVTMSMGPLGAVTRLCGETFGSCITYASVGEPSAPGQFPAEEVRMVQTILHSRTGLTQPKIRDVSET